MLVQRELGTSASRLSRSWSRRSIEFCEAWGRLWISDQGRVAELRDSSRRRSVANRPAIADGLPSGRSRVRFTAQPRCHHVLPGCKPRSQ